MSLTQIVEAIKKVASKLGISPSEVTKTELLSNSDVSEWNLRKLGGLTNIIKASFPVEKDLSETKRIKDAAGYIRRLENELASKELHEKTVQELVKNIKPIKPISPYKSKVKGKTQREMSLVLSDTHFGLIVKKKQVGGVNEFNWQIAGRRTAKVIQETIDYKKEKRHEVELLNVYIVGDVIAGLIHGANTKEIDLLIHQQNGALHILGNALSQLVPHFKKIKVHCLSGNHDDNVTKRAGGRVITEKFDSFINHTYYALSAMFRNNKSVEFSIPSGLYATHDSIGGRILVTHGDVIFSKALGNPGSSINVKSLSYAISQFNSGERIKKNPPIKGMIFGHVHTFSHFITNEGVTVLTNTSLSGIDGFAHSLGLNHNTVGQIIFETVKDYAIGDVRLVQVSDADNDKSLDKIIPPYEYGLKWK